ncbi:MAG: LysR family transcriptional regulator [Roseivivax sp.]|nr:LysR family transcriptional regulator [Roseivivax sp.]
MRNLDISTLRSFVMVAQAGGVTRASGFLNLTQSAVSMQLKRLESLLGQELLERTGRSVALTAAGEQLLSYARKMVDMNDEIFARLTEQTYEGELVFGVPHDIVYPVIPQVLQRYHAAYPRVKVQLVSSYTSTLKAQFSRGELDVILTTEPEVGPEGETLTEVPLRWVGAPGGSIWKQRPLRLAFCRNCGFKPTAMRMLETAGTPWEIAVESDSDRTVEATVSADLGVTAMLEGHAPSQLTYLDVSSALPDLGVQRVNMYAAAQPSKILTALMEMTRQGFAAL